MQIILVRPRPVPMSSPQATRFRNPYNLRDPRSLVEASFMMMNQVDSSSFDDDKYE